ncbi:hypothetical protein [Rhodococcus rhodnii]|uniref:Uncharacterized protein n=1 Tax=Rhodococcus rhodnii LMG 5362 TaxID=1273125 RepID=R7WWQ7_9NOCA|nr:hypothetical protein [Rhodococcus rhodnii]EOM78579.1 hypothetical protein Rrhod_0117 [Rhodococcus rhodnii LMG 5362]
MNTVLVYALFIVAGIALGGAYSMLKFNKVASAVLAVIAVLAAVGGILQFVE